MQDHGDFPSWCTAAVEHVSASEAKAVPYFQAAKRCHDVWRSLAPGGIPTRRQLDPIRLGPQLLPHISLIDVIADGSDYRWRLCGELVVTVIGTRLTGKLISDIEQDLGEAVLFRSALDHVVTDAKPLFYVLRHRTISGYLKRSYGVLLPLRGSNGASGDPQGPIQHILGAFDWTTGE